MEPLTDDVSEIKDVIAQDCEIEVECLLKLYTRYDII